METEIKIITGPVKFSFFTGKIQRRAMAFWCVMMRRDLVREIGLLDEVFSPGTGEDGDFCIRAEMVGHKLVQVPNDTEHKFGDQFNTSPFPIYHRGGATFQITEDDPLIKRNRQILNERYGMLDDGEKREPLLQVKPKYSIIIPTYNHAYDLLKPCLDSIIRYTDMRLLEIIVVANGCTDYTRNYIGDMQVIHPNIQLVWFDEALGYTKATNEGIKVAQGEYLVLLNNDTVLLEQPKNTWLDMLEAPFLEKQNVGLTGPLQLHDDYANAPVLIFFCVMIKREVFDKIGLLDEAFSPGGGEDIDFTIRARMAGYEAVQLEPTTFTTTNVGTFPIWHKDNQTFKDIPEYTRRIVKENGLRNTLRYNREIRLNLGGGGIRIPSFLSVDLNDTRADILMDVTKLNFQDGTVQEIIASHIFEHLNPYKVESILREWLRVLKVGSKLTMEMPDIEQLCARFVTATKAERYGILNAIYGSVNTTGEGDPSEITSPHLFGWWPESIWDTLHCAGFRSVVFGPERWPHPESNFHVEATKPLPNHAELRAREPLLYKEIFEENEYHVIEDEIRGKTVIDIGANVGYFSLLCVELGAKSIHAIEAQPVICLEGLVPNVKPYPQVVPYQYAITGSLDKTLVRIENNHVASRIEHLGTFDPVPGLDSCTTAIKLTSFFERFLAGETDTDMVLKLDCEGCEYNILCGSPSTLIRRFHMIYIEIHEDPHTRLDVENWLSTCGFERRHSHNVPGYPKQWIQKWRRIEHGQ